jgi:hypothetical protein
MDHDALAELHRLKYRYFRTLDLKLWDDFADTLAEDASARYGTHAMGEPLDLQGRQAIVDFMRTNLTGDVISMHLAQHPELDVGGDTARGTWGFQDTVIVPSSRYLLTGAGYYDDTYARGADGRWRITSTAYRRVFEATQPLPDGYTLAPV